MDRKTFLYGFIYTQTCSLIFSILGFSLLCSCGRNYSGQQENTDTSDCGRNYSGQQENTNTSDPLQAVLLTLQKDPTRINTLRVSVNSQQVPLLTAAVMLGEDTTTIESLLEKRVDVKAVDQEGTGILHALVGNSRLSDQQKAKLVDSFFAQADCADDIKTNITETPNRLERASNPFAQPLPAPWLRALDNGDSVTAKRIVKHMSLRQASRDGLYYAIRSGRSYDDFNVEDTNLFQLLLDKENSSCKIVEPFLNEHLGEDLTGYVQDYCEKVINVGSSSNTINGRPLWEHAWRGKTHMDVEMAVRIVQKMPYQRPPMSYSAMADQANEALAAERRVNGIDEASLQEINSGWSRIREAFIEIGVDGSLLHE